MSNPRSRGTGAAALAAALCALSASSSAQNVFASRVIAHQDNGQLGGGIFDPNNALGAPDGSTGVHSLGLGGSITLGFDVILIDGPGADFIVSENPFASTAAPWQTFAETCFVEVSTDGVHFARIPNRYTGPQVDPGNFAFVETGWYQGFGGVHSVRTGTPDHQDLVMSGGDAIDLADLQNHPMVLAGTVNLYFINQVRLVDVETGISVDSHGTVIRDPGSGSADIDAVTAIHFASNSSLSSPSVSIDIPASGAFSVTISDPDGFADIDPATFGFALWGVPVDPSALFAITVPTQISSTSFTLAFPGTLHLSIPLQMTVSLQDFAGNHSGASRAQP